MIVVLTCLRIPSCAEATLQQIDECTHSKKLLLVDGVDLLPHAGWDIVCHPRPIVPPQNKWTAWEAFEIANRANEELVFFEDDLNSARMRRVSSKTFLYQMTLAFVTFFSPGSIPRGRIGLWRRPRAQLHDGAGAQVLSTDRTGAAAYKEEAMAIGPGGFDEALHHIAVSTAGATAS